MTLASRAGSSFAMPTPIGWKSIGSWIIRIFFALGLRFVDELRGGHRIGHHAARLALLNGEKAEAVSWNVSGSDLLSLIDISDVEPFVDAMRWPSKSAFVARDRQPSR